MVATQQKATEKLTAKAVGREFVRQVKIFRCIIVKHKNNSTPGINIFSQLIMNFQNLEKFKNFSKFFDRKSENFRIFLSQKF